MRRIALAFVMLSVSCVPPPRAGMDAPIFPPTPKKVAPPAETVYVKAGRLFDGTGNDVREHMAIVIRNERIEKVGRESEVPVPEGAKVIDLSHATVLPGLIDCHVHLSMRADQWDPIWAFRKTRFDSAFSAVKHAAITLEAGFTSVRDLGSPPFLAVDLRKAIDAGYLVGPRMVASGPSISQTGGHGDLNGYAPRFDDAWDYPQERNYQIADGVDQIRHVVRAQIKHGVDVIKVHASGGVLSIGDKPGAPQFTLEELKAAAQEAHAGGRKITAHAHGAEGIKNAVLAGFDSIEHGSLIDDEGIRLMKQHGTWLVADIYNDDFILGNAKELGMEEEHIEKERYVGRIQRENFAKAHAAGVKIAFGTDAGVYPHGDNARQFAYMVKFGLTAPEAIRSATSDAAELLGRAADVGTLSPGHYGDFVAVTHDPLADIRVLEHIEVVVKGGHVVKNELAR